MTPAPRPEGAAASSPATDAVSRVRAALAAAGVAARVVEFMETTRTAQDAARALGTTPAQIVKSLVFVADGGPILVLASGANRVDLAKVARLAGAARVDKAGAETVRAATGFSIGGVPPVGHRTAMPVYVDEALMAYDVVYAAAGTPHAVFPIAPATLARVTSGTVADLAECAGPPGAP
jgi:Cys-tRNA(Pro) deacylase